MAGLGQAALIFPASCFQHFNTHVTFIIKLEAQNGQRWDAVIAGLIPASAPLNRAFGCLMATSSRLTWIAVAEYLMIQHLVANAPESAIEILGWHQGLFLRLDWNTRIFTTSCRYFYVTIRQELDHELTGSSSESD